LTLGCGSPAPLLIPCEELAVRGRHFRLRHWHAVAFEQTAVGQRLAGDGIHVVGLDRSGAHPAEGVHPQFGDAFAVCVSTLQQVVAREALACFGEKRFAVR
jgi:hypothetical protein